MCSFAGICAGISLKISENLKAYILQAIAANEGTDCRFVLNFEEIERFFVAMHMKISLRAAFAYLLHDVTPKNAESHLGLFCLPNKNSSKNGVKIKNITRNTPKNKSGLIQWINSSNMG